MAHADSEQDSYDPDDERPLGSYAAIMAGHVGLVGAVLAWSARRGHLPERISPADLALGAVATFKLSRLLSRSTIASPIRAPFTRFEGPAGNAELEEEVRGTGLRHAVGELLTCPFCLGHWISTAYCLGLVRAPQLTRTVGAILCIDAGSDVLQLANARAQKAA